MASNDHKGATGHGTWLGKAPGLLRRLPSSGGDGFLAWGEFVPMWTVKEDEVADCRRQALFVETL